VRVIVAGELSQEPHNAPLHLFSASSDLVAFGQRTYQRRSEDTSLLLRQLLRRAQAEGLLMSYTMEDFRRDYVKEYFPQLTWEERREVLKRLPPDERLADLSPEERLANLTPDQIRQYLERLSAKDAGRPTRRRRKKQ
jgi:hypothetical protein